MEQWRSFRPAILNRHSWIAKGLQKGTTENVQEEKLRK
jgi:hypothetical protein